VTLEFFDRTAPVASAHVDSAGTMRKHDRGTVAVRGPPRGIDFP
jgi:hypothetical protein